MTAQIGWYVHHHGGGHLARLLTIAPHVDAEIRCFSSLAEPANLPAHCSWTLLDRDDDLEPGGLDPREADPTAGGLLHWAPLAHPGHRGRLARITASLAERPLDAFVVDVSAEVALLVRLLGVRTVVMTQPGVRDDDAHRLAFRAATTIIAPWPYELLAPAHLVDLSAKTVYTGGISRFEGRQDASSKRDSTRGDAAQNVVLLGGRGGSGVTDDDAAAAAAATGDHWRNLGGTRGASWSADPWKELSTADVVVAWAGQNSVADLAAAGARAIVIPQDRPFDEQRDTAHALEHAGLAVTAAAWPAASEWPALIARAARLQPDWTRWQVTGAAARAAEAIAETAQGRR